MMRVAWIFLAFFLAGCGRDAVPVVLHPADAPPERLSDWGVLVRSGAYLVPGNDVIPYELNVPLFSDYALKLRTVWLPEGNHASYAENGVIEFPVGTIISKTFHYESENKAELVVRRVEGEADLDDKLRLNLDRHVLIETRLLVRYESGWKGYPYVWSTSQDEAWLEVAGDHRNIRFHDSDEAFVYVVPDSNQCAGCHTPDHTAKTLQPIGPKTWQLNRVIARGASTYGQLEHWVERGLLESMPDPLRASVRWSDPQDGSPEERVRAYLDVNCAHCHNARGAADTSALHLDIDAPLDRHYGICKSPVAVGRGSGNRPYDIVPGDPDNSIMLYRMQHTDPAIAMPELGRSTVHAEGVELVADWISSLQGSC